MPNSFADYEPLAEAVLPPATYDFIAGGSGTESTLHHNRKALDRVALVPRVLAGVSSVDTRWRGVGDAAAHAIASGSAPIPAAMPVAVAPMAYQRLLHPEGELALARAAAEAGVPYAISTLSSYPLEKVAGFGPSWFQVYWLRERRVVESLVGRAEAAGCSAVMVTVDVPVMGRRLRDVRNSFALPEDVVAANLVDVVTEAHVEVPGLSAVAAHTASAFEPAVTWQDLEWLRARTELPLLIKGILDPRDAVRAVEVGANGIVVSNHGGRQLDGAVASIDALPDVVDAVGKQCEVLLDSGIRSGTDVLRALALGASAVLVGRPLLWALAVDACGEAFELLRRELADAMMLAGCADLAAAARLTTGEGLMADLDVADLHGSLTDRALNSMNFLNEVANHYPDAISLAAGRPYEEFYAIEDLHSYLDTFANYLRETQDEAGVTRTVFQYGRTKGIIHPLIARNLELDEGIVVDPDALVVTVGCQEAMVLVLRALRADPTDVLLAVSPAYVGITGAARLVDLPVLPVAGGNGGVDLEDLVAVVKKARAEGLRPRACYVMPDFANPSGLSLDLDTRHRLLEVAAQEELLLLEDNPYGLFLADDAERVPTLKALDTERRVIYLGSFAKTALPGARVGYVVADQTVAAPDGTVGLLADELSKIKSMVTVNTSAVGQAMIGGKLLENDCSLVAANRRERAIYAGNLRAITDGLAARFPGPPAHAGTGSADSAAAAPAPRSGKVSWTVPAGGFFVVVTVPFPVDDALLEKSAHEYGVLWTPMGHFYDGDAPIHALRLSCSSVTPSQIEAALNRLEALINDHL